MERLSIPATFYRLSRSRTPCKRISVLGFLALALVMMSLVFGTALKKKNSLTKPYLRQILECLTFLVLHSIWRCLNRSLTRSLLLGVVESPYHSKDVLPTSLRKTQLRKGNPETIVLILLLISSYIYYHLPPFVLVGLYENSRKNLSKLRSKHGRLPSQSHHGPNSRSLLQSYLQTLPPQSLKHCFQGNPARKGLLGLCH